MSVLLSHKLFVYHTKFSLCFVAQTDDKGVFATTLSEEYALAAQTFHLSPDQIWSLSFTALDYIFADGDVKERLRKKWVEIKSSLLGSGCEPE